MDDDPPAAPKGEYQLDTQAGFLLRRATQRHLAIFAGLIPALTPTQFAALAKLAELGPTSQNALGRATAMDAATIKGVIDRLRQRGLVDSTRDPDDQRRIHVAATPAGQALFDELQARAGQITRDTLAPLTPREQAQFLALLAKIT